MNALKPKETDVYNSTQNIEEVMNIPLESSYQYIIDEAKYIDNGMINLVSNQKPTPFELSKSNEDLRSLETRQREEEKQEILSEENQPEGESVIKARAVFRRSGQITSREQRARTISLRKDGGLSKKKAKGNSKTYAIDYTKQDNYLPENLIPASISGWSAKRFKRYPRFTIFLANSKKYIYHLVGKGEDTISLNPQFLNFLMSPEKANEASDEFNEALNLLASQNLRKFDPFDNVVLSNKGIDNPILTSFRTLAKTNNSLSNTFKIIHNKFMPGKTKLETDKQITKWCGCHPPPDLSGDVDIFLPQDQVYSNTGGCLESTKIESQKLYDSVDKFVPKTRPNLKSNAKRGLKEFKTITEKHIDSIENPISLPKHLFFNRDISDATLLEILNDASIILPETTPPVSKKQQKRLIKNDIPHGKEPITYSWWI
jgi:hypothetical protein